MSTSLTQDWLTQWLTKGMPDFEYKKYLLLAHLQKVRDYFDKKHLYPFFSRIVEQYRNLIALRESDSLIREAFPKQVKGIDYTQYRLLYLSDIDQDITSKLLNQMINYALKEMKPLINKGMALHEKVETSLSLESFGLSSLYKQEGYLLLERQNEIRVFFYQLSPLYQDEGRFMGLGLRLLKKHERTLSNGLDKIHRDLIAESKEIAHPSVYVIRCQEEGYPVRWTLLPVVQRMLMRYLARETHHPNTSAHTA